MNIPKSSIRNGNSLNGAASRPPGNFLGPNVVRGRTVKTATICSTKIMNAHVLIVQGYPTAGIMRLIMIGKMTPPTDDPVTITPMAAPRLFANQVEMQASASRSKVLVYEFTQLDRWISWQFWSNVPGEYKHATPMALHTPCDKMN